MRPHSLLDIIKHFLCAVQYSEMSHTVQDFIKVFGESVLKRTDIIGNSADYCELIRYLFDLDLVVLTTVGDTLNANNLMQMVENESYFYVFLKDDTDNLISSGRVLIDARKQLHYIYVARSTPFIIGCVCWDGPREHKLNTMYNDIKRYIRNKYTISYDKCYYAGNMIFESWVSRQFVAPFVTIKARFFEIELKAEEIEQLISYCKSNGYSVRTTEQDIRKAQNQVVPGDDFLIHSPEMPLHTYRHKWKVYYTLDSEAVFVYNRKSNRGFCRYRFIADERNFDALGLSPTAILFHKVSTYCTGNNFRILRTETGVCKR